jgi:hypothetical protein
MQIMSILIEGFLMLMQLVFERQRWYFVILHSLLLLLLIGFSLVMAIAVSKIFKGLDGTATRFAITVLFSIMMVASVAALWWVFFALLKKTAKK